MNLLVPGNVASPGNKSVLKENNMISRAGLRNPQKMNSGPTKLYGMND